jgi:phosphatidylinositol alpha-mannosyltransferase
MFIEQPLKNMAEISIYKIGILLDTSLDLEDGVQQYVMAIGEWLRSQGHDVHYLVGQTNSRQLPNIHSLSKNISVTFNGNKIDLPLYGKRKKIRELMEREKFDVLHVQTPHHPLLAQRIIRMASPQTAVVATFHVLPYGKVAEIGNTVLGWVLRPSLRRIDTMLAVSSSAAQFEKRTFGLDAMVLPNVFDYSLFHSSTPLAAYNDDVLTILFLGRLVERKGCQTLLAAVALLAERKNIPKFRVVVCGKGALRAKLERQARDAGIADLVEFTGFVSDADKPHYYAAADIAVFPSSAGESFGIVLLEAMASGRAAVLAGDNPGYRTVMEPQPNLLFRPKDSLALADKLELLLKDEQQRKSYAQWGADYSARFDVMVVGEQLLTIYRDLYARRNMQ